LGFSLTGQNGDPWLRAAEWTFLLASFGLVLALIRVAFGRAIRLLCLMEILISTGLLLFIVDVGSSAAIEAFDTQSRTNATLGMLLMAAGAFGIGCLKMQDQAAEPYS